MNPQSSLTSEGFFSNTLCLLFVFLFLLPPPSSSSFCVFFNICISIQRYRCKCLFLDINPIFPNNCQSFWTQKKNGICDCHLSGAPVLPTTTTVLTPNLPGETTKAATEKLRETSHAPQLLKLFWNLPFCQGLWFGRHFGWEILSHHFCFLWGYVMVVFLQNGWNIKDTTLQSSYFNDQFPTSSLRSVFK